MALSTVHTGEAIGYGSRWIADKPTRTALVSIGYGDGYPRVVNEHAYVSILVADNGAEQQYHCPVRGRVAMDMIVVDVSALPESLPLDSKVIDPLGR